MVKALDRQNPTAFSIPEEIRNYFSEGTCNNYRQGKPFFLKELHIVSTGPSGEYVDLKEYKPPKTYVLFFLHDIFVPFAHISKLDPKENDLVHQKSVIHLKPRTRIIEGPYAIVAEKPAQYLGGEK